jgi:hypothetical protein
LVSGRVFISITLGWPNAAPGQQTLAEKAAEHPGLRQSAQWRQPGGTSQISPYDQSCERGKKWRRAGNIKSSYGRISELEQQNLPAAASSTAATVTAAISAASTAPATAAALGFGPGFVDVQGAAAELRAVQGGDGFLAILIAGHLDETEPPGTPGVTVRHDAYAIYLSV